MEVATRPDGVVVVNDAYNANPESTRAALEALAAITPAGGGRRWAVLGGMAELGEETAAAHAEVGRAARALGVDRLVAVGDVAGPSAAAFGQGAARAADVPAAVALLEDALRPGDVVLVKGSRSAGLERVAEALLVESAAAEGAR
jgi:UDP-N-acetylmuramoyl-tripeptide--D-alanyl-D-alanine ligase